MQVKLVLEAFQLSAAQAVAYPRAPGLLRCLMVGRLATAQLSPALQVRGFASGSVAGFECSNGVHPPHGHTAGCLASDMQLGLLPSPGPPGDLG